MVFQCKMCGGSLQVNEGDGVVLCEYCGTNQTLPRMDSDHRRALCERALSLRRNNEFDRAAAIYEEILKEDPTDAECYWSLVLCRFGIEYVEDVASRRRVPTVNRAQLTSVFDDEDYKSALRYASAAQRTLYEAEAREINEIQKGILAISQKEDPFDVFICYKETGADGRRTRDSVLAAELYQELTEAGYKVFFARITLEDKLGTAYEPYIFAALHSAPVMVVLGTKKEHFEAVWVKNEWSRYLALIRAGEKKILIPAYRDMDAYDLPEEFSHLQAQDMSKLGFMQDLVHGIKKIVGREEGAFSVQSGEVASLLKRARLFLGEKLFWEAEEYCERALDLSPECAEAYLCKLMVQAKASREEELVESPRPLSDYPAYRVVLRVADDALAARLAGYNSRIVERLAREAKNRRNQPNVFSEVDVFGSGGATGESTIPVMPTITYTPRERKTKYLLLGIVFLFVFWPVGLWFLWKWYKGK